MGIKGFSATGRRATLVVLSTAALLISAQTSTRAALGVDDYPYRGTVGVRDPWGFFSGYCTSFVAWRLTQAGFHFSGASLRGPNGQTRQFGNGGNWDSAATQVGFTVDSHPAPGAVAVWHGGEGYAWPTGHVGYVIAVDSSGRARVEEYNWGVRYGYGQRLVAAPRYIHFSRGESVAPGVSTAPATMPAFREYRVTQTVNRRRGPGLRFATLGTVRAGATIRISCQTRSSSFVHGSPIWDRLVDGSYVTDYYTTTPGYRTFSRGLPHC